jgi:hypothetical protein
MKRSTCVIVGFLTLAATATAHGQDDTTLAAARRFVGCYAVELGAWSKPVVPNPSYDAPPVAVSLDSVLIDGRGGPGFRLAPTIEILTRYVTIPPRWWPIGADSVRLWWPSGFGGAALRLAWNDGVLRGKAEVFSDMIRREVLPDGSERILPESHATAALRPVACR